MEISTPKMSYIHRPAVQPLEHRTIIQLFDTHTKCHPERDAFVMYDQSGQRSNYTFTYMQQHSMYLAASFLRLGWKRGDRIVLMLPSRAEFLLSYLALLRIGANILLLPPSGKGIDDVLQILDKCQGLVFIENESESFNNSVNQFLNKKFSDPSKVVIVDQDQKADLSKGLGYSKYSELLKSGEALPLDEVLKTQDKVQFDDPAVVLFTSGSTGIPKGVQHTHHSVVNAALELSTTVYDIKTDGQSGSSECRLFNDRPFYWIGALHGGINVVLVAGCTLVTAPSIKSLKECDVNFLLQILQNEKCTKAVFVAFIVFDLATSPETANYDLSSLETVLTAGQSLPEDVFKKLGSILPRCKLLNGYGLTEVLSVALEEIRLHASTASVDEPTGMTGVPSTEIKIIDDNQNLVPVGHVGQICIRSPNCFLKYLDNEEETSKAISSTGWVHTGDMGVMNQKGMIKIKGRNSDMIKRATVKIFPAEIEKILIKYPDVKNVAVVGIPDARLYEEICACVIPKEGSPLISDVSEFEKWMDRQWTVGEQGLSLKPKELLLMEEFPLTKTGKTDKKALRIIAAQKLGIQC